MARSLPNSAITLPVLDRLIDDDPRTQIEAPLTRAQSVRILRASVRRDLEWLLNTRRVPFVPETGAFELKRSVYVYGLPDFTSYSLASNKDRARLLEHLEATVRLFEPRLTDVRIVPVPGADTGAHALHFRIQGMLKMDPAPEYISFDTVLELSSGAYLVKGDADAG